MLRTVRRQVVATLALLVGALLFATTAQAAPPAHSRSPKKQVTVVAHRGASAYAPENTLPAIEEALRMKADFVEIDVQMTADGQLVVMHDTTLARTTNVEELFPDRAPWRVADFTLEEIKQLDAGSWFDESFAGTEVPTLAEVLEAMRGRAGLLLEVKSPNLYPGIGEAILEVLGDRGGWVQAAARAGRLVVQSFDWEFMKSFNDLAPQIPAGLLGGPPTEEQLVELSEWADQINPSFRRVDEQFVDLVHRVGMVTWPYTVNDPEQMRRLIELGVDGIITNNPDVLRSVLRESAGPASARR
ncbi:MAG: glycerophosphodiester phosphodiesterase [Actinomycetota bacterium]|nr:glycerophosphodiester phosphodiesterase [Actinomycetota bacterium]